jgi:hypothetical protein
VNRRIGFAVAGLVMAVAVLLVWQRPASAQIPGLPSGLSDKATCRAAPNPATPDGGMIGLLVEPPTNPWNGDPFTDTTHDISEKYGLGGLEFVTYDQGCYGQAVSAGPNWVENLLWRAPIYMTALAGSVMGTMMHPTFLGVFDPLIERTARQVHDGPFALMIPVTFGLVGLYVIVRALRDRAVSSALSAGGWLLLVIAIASVFATSPLWAVRQFDDNTLAVTQAVGSGFGGSDTLVGSVHRNILYKQWLAGTFGDPNGPAANKYGAALFDAGVYPWSEWQSMQTGVVDAAKLKETKQQKWQDIADKVQHEFPVAYEHLQGQHIPDRTFRSGFALFGVVGATLFQIIAGMAFVVAVILVRFFVLAWPIAVILGAFPTKRLVLVALWQCLIGGVVAAVACAVAAGLVSLFIGQILAATELAGWLTLFLMLAVFVAAWIMLRRYRSFAHGHVGSAARKAGKAIVAVKVGEHVVEKGTKDNPPAEKTAGPPNAGGAPPPPRRRPNEGHHAAGFTRPRDPRDPQVGAYRPQVAAGPEPAAIGAATSKEWRHGDGRWVKQEPAAAPGPRQRVQSTSASTPNPPDGGSRAATPPRAKPDSEAPIETRRISGKDGRDVYVPIRR